MAGHPHPALDGGSLGDRGRAGPGCSHSTELGSLRRRRGMRGPRTGTSHVRRPPPPGRRRPSRSPCPASAGHGAAFVAGEAPAPGRTRPPIRVIPRPAASPTRRPPVRPGGCGRPATPSAPQSDPPSPPDSPTECTWRQARPSCGPRGRPAAIAHARPRSGTVPIATPGRAAGRQGHAPRESGRSPGRPRPGPPPGRTGVPHRWTGTARRGAGRARPAPRPRVPSPTGSRPPPPASSRGSAHPARSSPRAPRTRAAAGGTGSGRRSPA
jgi:hypothetical protein